MATIATMQVMLDIPEKLAKFSGKLACWPAMPHSSSSSRSNYLLRGADCEIDVHRLICGLEDSRESRATTSSSESQ